MVEGFWIVQFEGIQGGGGGVLILMRGKVLGGDSGYTYQGTYEERGAFLTARVQVRNFLADVPNVLGFMGDFELQLDGKLEGKVIQGSAAPVGRTGAGIAVKLTKLAELP